MGSSVRYADNQTLVWILRLPLFSRSVSLTHLQSFETVLLIQPAISASLSLTLLTAKAGSERQFDQLSALLGEGIIDNIWLYASDKPDVILASLDTMLCLITSLAVGNGRDVKVRSKYLY